MTGGAARKVLLMGMMGAGKTSVGESLAARTGWPYVDNDRLLERATGLAGPAILAAEGEQGLRAAESRVLTVLLGMPGPLIGGVPGGVVLDEADRDRIASAGAHVVWLRAAPKVLARRVAGGPARAWLGNDPEAALRRLAAERHAWYEQLADQVIDVDALTVGAVAKLVAEQLPD